MKVTASDALLLALFVAVLALVLTPISAQWHAAFTMFDFIRGIQ